MNREEFIGVLERTLRGAGASEALIWDNINYYSNYFREEMNKGRSEEDIIGELGDPRLIAKTIIGVLEDDGYEETSGNYEEAGRGDHQREEDYQNSNKYGNDRNGGFRAEFGENGWDVRLGNFKVNSWYGYLLIGLIIFAVLSLVMAVIGGIFSLIAPIAVPLLVILLVVRLFSKRN